MTRPKRSALFEPNYGQDVDITIPFKELDGSDASLHGLDISVFDASPEFTTPTNLITATIVNANTGLVHVRIEWDDRLLLGQDYRLRLKMTDGPDDLTSNPIGVRYQ